MIELKKEFNKKGMKLTQLYKDDELVVYEVKQGNDYWYEVFSYKVKKPNNLVNDFFEAYPSSSDFGQWAWCCGDEGCVAKVLYNHFPTHLMTSELKEFVDGTYSRNGVDMPHFKINKLELSQIMFILQEH